MKMTEKMEELMDKKIYMLVGADAIEVLHQMGKEEIIEDEEELENLLEFIDSRLEIEWTESVEAAIESYLFRKELD